MAIPCVAHFCAKNTVNNTLTPRKCLLQRCLQVFNVSGNGLDTIADLDVLRHLTHFMASDNELNDMKEMIHILSSWSYLTKLELIGNPLCHKSKYKDRLIVIAPHLGKM